jgi:UDP-glucose:tetrahydrobiopterin glucosyltransferase
VEPDSVNGLVGAIGRLDEIDRSACRRQAEVEYNLGAAGELFESWFKSILKLS